jgi:hypothetical protein
VKEGEKKKAGRVRSSQVARNRSVDNSSDDA